MQNSSVRIVADDHGDLEPRATMSSVNTNEQDANRRRNQEFRERHEPTEEEREAHRQRNRLYRARLAQRRAAITPINRNLRNMEDLAPESFSSVEQNVEAAALLAAEISGHEVWNTLCKRIEDLEALEETDDASLSSRSSVEPEEDHDHHARRRELEQLLGEMSRRIDASLPTENEMIDIALQFQNVMKCDMALPACASCGIRALPSDAMDYRSFDLNNLGVLQRLPSYENWEVSHEERTIRSWFQVPDTSISYHLHPELVESRACSDSERGGAGGEVRYFCRCCPTCAGAVDEGKIPKRSIAAGHDFGLLSRVFGLDANRHTPPLTFAEKLSLAVFRPYIQILKLKPSDNMRSSFVGHGITFPQNAPDQLLARAEDLVQASMASVHEGDVDDVERFNRLVVDAVTRTLQVVFVGPQHLHGLMRRTGMANSDLRIRGHLVFRILETLRSSSPNLYGHVPRLTDTVQRGGLVNAWNNIPHLLMENAQFLESEADVNYERVATALTSEMVDTASTPSVSTTGTASPASSVSAEGGAAFEGDNKADDQVEVIEIPTHHSVVTSRSALVGGNAEGETAGIRAIQNMVRLASFNARRGVTGSVQAGGPAPNVGVVGEVNTAVRIGQTSNDPLNEYTENERIIAGSFPHLFPLGYVTLRDRDNRPVPLQAEDIEHLLRQFTNVFATEERFLYLLFNQAQRQSAARGVWATLRNREASLEGFDNLLIDREFLTALDRSVDLQSRSNLTDSERQEATEARKLVLRKAYPVIKLSGSNVAFSSMERSTNLSKLYALTQVYGQPSVFFTVALDEGKAPLVLRLISAINSNSSFPAVANSLMEALQTRALEYEHLDLRPDAIKKKIGGSPVATALFFKQVLEILLYDVLCCPGKSRDADGRLTGPDKKTKPLRSRSKGVFGKIRTFFGAIETQGRGALHLHICLWPEVTPKVVSFAAGRGVVQQAIERFVKSQVSAEVPLELQVAAVFARNGMWPTAPPSSSILDRPPEGYSNPAIEGSQTQTSFAGNDGDGAVSDAMAVNSTETMNTNTRDVVTLQATMGAGRTEQQLHPLTRPILMPYLPTIPRPTYAQIVRLGQRVAVVANNHEHTGTCRQGKKGAGGCRVSMPRGPSDATSVLQIDAGLRAPANSNESNSTEEDTGSSMAVAQHSSTEESDNVSVAATTLQLDAGFRAPANSNESNSTEEDTGSSMAVAQPSSTEESDDGLHRSGSSHTWEVLVRNEPRVRLQVTDEPQPEPPLPSPTITNPVPRELERVLVVEPERPRISLANLEAALRDETSSLRDVNIFPQALQDRLQTEIAFRRVVEAYGSHMVSDDINIAQKRIEKNELFLEEIATRNLYFSEYNPVISACVRSNTNVQYLGSHIQGKTTMMYLAKYMCKDLVEVRNSFTILRDCLRHNLQFPSNAPDVDAVGSIRRFKALIQRYLNTLNGTAEVSAEAAVYTLLKGRSFVCPETFRFVSVTPAVEQCLLNERNENERHQHLMEVAQRTREEARSQNQLLQQAANLARLIEDHRRSERGDAAESSSDEEEDDGPDAAIATVDMEEERRDILHAAFGEGEDVDEAIADILAGGPAAVQGRNGPSGSCPLYLVGVEYRPVSNEHLYRYRGPLLEFLSFELWHRLIRIERIPSGESGPSDGDGDQQAEAGNALAEEDVEQQRGRAANARFSFEERCTLRMSHRQVLVSLIQCPILSGARPPVWPGNVPTRLTAGTPATFTLQFMDWVKKANAFAAYFLVLFKPWSRATGGPGPLSWVNFQQFILDLRAESTVLSRYAEQRIRQIAFGINVKKSLSQVQTFFRSRNTDSWNSVAHPVPDFAIRGRRHMGSIEGNQQANNRSRSGGFDDVVDDNARQQRVREFQDQLASSYNITELLENERRQITMIDDAFSRVFDPVDASDRADLHVEGDQEHPDSESHINTVQNAPATEAFTDLRCVDVQRRIRDSETPQSVEEAVERQQGVRRLEEVEPGSGEQEDLIAALTREWQQQQDQRVVDTTPPSEVLEDNQPDADVALLQNNLNREQRVIAEELLRYNDSLFLYRAQGGDDNEALSVPVPPYLLVQGGPGTGKTHLMNIVDRICRIRQTRRRQVQTDAIVGEVGGMIACAPTGVAASHLRGGRTYQSLFKLTRASNRGGGRMEEIKRRILKEELGRAAFILIDEVSMLGASALSQIDEKVKDVFRDVQRRQNMPFGGLCIVLQGDFFQLPPVKSTSLFVASLRFNQIPTARRATNIATGTTNLRSNEEAGAVLFQRYHLRLLSIQQRAASDPNHVAMISRMGNFLNREPNQPRLTLHDLQRLHVLQPSDAQREPFRSQATIFTSGNKQRTLMNRKQAIRFGVLNNVPIFIWRLNMRMRVMGALEEEFERNVDNDDGPTRNRRSAGEDISVDEYNLLSELDKQGLEEYFVHGAPAFLTENYSVNWRLANGSKVVMHSMAFADEHHDAMMALIRDARPGEITVLPVPPLFVNVQVPDATVGNLGASWPAHMNLNTSGDGRIIIPIGRERKRESFVLSRPIRAGVGRTVSTSQLALDIGFCVTYHKGQGATLDCMIADVRTSPEVQPAFDFTMAYVAFTRVRHGNDLRILSFRQGGHHPANASVYQNQLTKLQPPYALLLWFAGFDITTERVQPSDDGAWDADRVRAALQTDIASRPSGRPPRAQQQQPAQSLPAAPAQIVEQAPVPPPAAPQTDIASRPSTRLQRAQQHQPAQALPAAPAQIVEQAPVPPPAALLPAHPPSQRDDSASTRRSVLPSRQPLTQRPESSGQHAFQYNDVTHSVFFMAVVTSVFQLHEEDIPPTVRSVQNSLRATVNQNSTVLYSSYPSHSPVGSLLQSFMESTPLWDRLITILRRQIVDRRRLANPFARRGRRFIYRYLNNVDQERILIPPGQSPDIIQLLEAVNGLVHAHQRCSRSMSAIVGNR